MWHHRTSYRLAVWLDISRYFQLIFQVKSSNEKKMDAESCSICLEDYQENDRVFELIICEHKFHEACLLEWAAMWVQLSIFLFSVSLSQASVSYEKFKLCFVFPLFQIQKQTLSIVPIGNVVHAWVYSVQSSFWYTLFHPDCLRPVLVNWSVFGPSSRVLRTKPMNSPLLSSCQHVI